MFLALTLLLTNLLYHVDCMTLAAAGYYAANPLIRNMLMSKGLGRKFGTQADILYNLSGFRGVSDQGIGRRQANTVSHDIVEIDADEFSRRYGLVFASQSLNRVKRDHPSHEEKKYMEELFAVAQRMDRKFCVSRVVCEIGANPKKFGQTGQRIHHYLDNMPPVPWNSATYPYTEAFATGREGGIDACSEDYGSCSYDLQKLVKVLQASGIPMKIYPTSLKDGVQVEGKSKS